MQFMRCYVGKITVNPRLKEVKLIVIEENILLSLFHKSAVLGKKLFKWNILHTNGIQRE